MIDFIYTIITGFDYPGLTKAIDPITLGLLVGQTAQQIGKARSAKQQREAALAQQQRGKNLYDKMVQEFKEGKYDVKLSQDVRDVAEQQRILAEQVSDAATQRGEAMIQSALAASRYGDPRSAALIPGQLRQVEAGVQQAELAGLGQKVAADTALAAQQQRVAEQNIGLQQQLAAMQLQRGAGTMDAGELAAQQAEQARRDAISAAIAAGSQGLVSSIGGIELGGESSVEDPSKLVDYLDNGDIQDYNIDSQPTNPLLQEDQPLFGEEGAKYKFAQKGGEVHMTEGEFNHDTNKKALVDEETGVKEAELTGDEAMVRDGDNVLVFNPEQQDTIEELVNKGDAKGLLKKMRDLMKQFEKQNG
jgi:hypothetical protein